jgi:hypothetical protein
MDDQQLPASPATSQLGRSEIVPVLDRFDDPLEWASAQTFRTALRSPSARLEERWLILDQLGEPSDRGVRKRHGL